MCHPGERERHPLGPSPHLNHLVRGAQSRPPLEASAPGNSRIRDIGPKLRFLAAWATPRRRSSLSALLLLLALLAPFSVGFFNLASGPKITCGMECCKRSKVCCCHRSGRGAHASGVGLSAGPSCPPGCRQIPGLRGSAPALAAVAQPGGVPIAPAAPARILESTAQSSIEPAFSLFERPPPAV
jgi:hypothetical protein